MDPIKALLLGLDPRDVAPAWQRDAACKEHPEVNFFPEKGEDVRPALAVCRGCLVVDECRAWAVENYEAGIWGGTSGRQRRGMRQAPAA